MVHTSYILVRCQPVLSAIKVCIFLQIGQTTRSQNNTLFSCDLLKGKIGLCFDFKRKLTYTAQNQEGDGHAARGKSVARVTWGSRQILLLSVLHFLLPQALFSLGLLWPAVTLALVSVEVHGVLCRIQDFVLPGW